MTDSVDDLERLEREHAEELARLHAALAEAQDRSYWLERWGVDLNQLMLRPGARRARAALRAARELRRGAVSVKRYASARAGEMRQSAHEDEIAAAAAEARTRATARSNGSTPRD
jgi:hypothetical protein